MIVSYPHANTMRLFTVDMYRVEDKGDHPFFQVGDLISKPDFDPMKKSKKYKIEVKTLTRAS